MMETIAPRPSTSASIVRSSTVSSKSRPTIGRLGAGGLRLADARDAEDVQRLAHAPQVLRAELLEVEAGLDLALRRRADEDAALAGELLEARGDVDGVAERVPGVVPVVAVLLDADDDRPRVHADTDRERDAVGRLDLLRVLGQRALDGERGAQGALGVVLVRDGDAEERQHLVADELRHGAVEAPDLLGHDPHDLVDQELRALRAELLRDRRRADDVRDEHRDDPPLACCHRHRRSYSCVTRGN